MKWILYLLLLVVTVGTAPKGIDVGKLQPVEIVVVSEENDMIILETDTGDHGEGHTVEEALKDLQESSQGIVILDTSEYLLLDRGAERYLDEIKSLMKGSVRVSYVRGEKDLKAAGSYLNIHKPKLRLKDVKKGKIEEILVFEDMGKENQKKLKIILDK